MEAAKTGLQKILKPAETDGAPATEDDVKNFTMMPITAMANGITTMLNFVGRSVNVYGTCEEPWFCGKAVASLLGYKKPNDALTTHVDNEDRESLENVLFRVSGFHGYHFGLNKNDLSTTYISESGVYSLVFGSKLPAARLFKNCITKHVIPSIRRAGMTQLAAVLPKQIDMSEEMKRELEEAKRMKEEAERKAAEEKERADEAEAKLQKLSVIKDKHLVAEQKHGRDQSVYIASNPQHWADDTYKVGKTINSGDERMPSLNTSHTVAHKFTVLYEIKCHDAAALEARIHNLLANKRVDKKREFFNVPYVKLVEICELVARRMIEDIDDYNGLAAELLDMDMPHGADAEARVEELKTALVPVTHFTNMRGAKDDEIAKFVECAFAEYRALDPTVCEFEWAPFVNWLGPKMQAARLNRAKFKAEAHKPKIAALCVAAGMAFKCRGWKPASQ